MAHQPSEEEIEQARETFHERNREGAKEFDRATEAKARQDIADGYGRAPGESR